MTDLPSYSGMTPEQAFERLQAWYQKNAQLKTLKTHEHLERVALAEYYFPQANEGTNRLPLGGGFDLKLQHGYRYTVTDEDLDQVAAKDIKRLKLPWDDLFVYKPELKLSEYRKLTPEQKAADPSLDPRWPDFVRCMDRRGFGAGLPSPDAFRQVDMDRLVALVNEDGPFLFPKPSGLEYVGTPASDALLACADEVLTRRP